MTPSETLTLRTGVQVSSESYHSLCQAVEILIDQGNMFTIHSLVKKCQDASFKLIPSAHGDAKSVLKQYNLLDENDNVREDIRQIVLSGIEESSESLLRVAIPIQGDIIELKFSKKK